MRCFRAARSGVDSPEAARIDGVRPRLTGSTPYPLQRRGFPRARRRQQSSCPRPAMIRRSPGWRKPPLDKPRTGPRMSRLAMADRRCGRAHNGRQAIRIIGHLLTPRPRLDISPRPRTRPRRERPRSGADLPCWAPTPGSGCRQMRTRCPSREERTRVDKRGAARRSDARRPTRQRPGSRRQIRDIRTESRRRAACRTTCRRPAWPPASAPNSQPLSRRRRRHRRHRRTRQSPLPPRRHGCRAS